MGHYHECPPWSALIRFSLSVSIEDKHSFAAMKESCILNGNLKEGGTRSDMNIYFTRISLSSQVLCISRQGEDFIEPINAYLSVNWMKDRWTALPLTADKGCVTALVISHLFFRCIMLQSMGSVPWHEKWGTWLSAVETAAVTAVFRRSRGVKAPKSRRRCGKNATNDQAGIFALVIH